MDIHDDEKRRIFTKQVDEIRDAIQMVVFALVTQFGHDVYCAAEALLESYVGLIVGAELIQRGISAETINEPSSRPDDEKFAQQLVVDLKALCKKKFRDRYPEIDA